MKRYCVVNSFLLLFFISFYAYGNDVTFDTASAHQSRQMGTTLNITIGTYTFKATLLENETTKAFKAMLPLTLLMSELNGNEKYFHFSSDLPTHPSKLGTIHAGDVMLWGSNSFVLFYQTFSTSYAYTRLGHIEDTTYLQQALGKGNVMVSLALE